MNARHERYDVLLFDLGHVLLDFAGPQGLDALTGGRHGVPEIARRWSGSPALRRFETGQCDALEFAREFAVEWEIALSPEDLLAEFSTWAIGVYPGALELVSPLKNHYRLAVLSNINDAYWPRCRDEFGLGALFERCYVSHEMGMMKPDPAIYTHVMEDLGVAPERIAFFDDSPPNVRAACELGLDAYRVMGVDALRVQLEALQLIGE
ncbi:MAG: HAD family hydrolase [Gammaproteobacteria bacterium]